MTIKRNMQVFDYMYIEDPLRSSLLTYWPHVTDIINGSYLRWYPNSNTTDHAFICADAEGKRTVKRMNKWLIQKGMENDGRVNFYVLIYMHW